MEHASALPWLSFRKEPRPGQTTVFEQIDRVITQLNIKLPTGYGKTYTACGVYSILQKLGRANRLLMIFPTDGQLEQFKEDARSDSSDLRATNVDGPLGIEDLRFFGVEAIKHHRRNTCQVFAITIQSLIQGRGWDTVTRLLETGQWMICVDEYHHYGIEKSWGATVLRLSRAFLLAMSATPYRPEEDSAFGVPQILVSYREAAEEKAVKVLIGHAYAYRLDAITEDGEVKSFTTAELIDEAGGDSPDKVEKLRIKSKMRWSPKYISPLVNIPIERMLVNRIATGRPLQALIGATCVSHADLICKQIKDMYPLLRVDWVGTGEYGRSDEENKRVLALFCPPKDSDGERKIPEVDILVHVGKAGEGLDCVYVSEYVFLKNATPCNKVMQEAGRASRRLGDIEGNINFDSTSEFAGSPETTRNPAKPAYTGEAFMDAMDFLPPSPDPEGAGKDPGGDPPEPPWEPTIYLLNMELIAIDSGSQQVQRMAKVMKEGHIGGIDYQALADKNHPEWQKIISLYKIMRDNESSAHNLESEIKQREEALNSILSTVTGLVIKRSQKGALRFDKSLPGDIKKRINLRKRILFGEVKRDPDVLKAHYHWLKELDTQIRKDGIPEWLS